MTPRTPALPLPPLHAAGAALALGAFLVVAPEAVPFAVPALAALLALALATPSIRDWETAGLVGVLVLSISAIGSDADGADALEITFGAALLLYVLGWYGTTLLGGRRFVRSWTDVAALAFFVVAGGGGLLVALVFGIAGTDLRSDLTCLLAFALFFPAREVCIRSERGPELLGDVLLVLALAATAASALRLYNALTGATEIYEIVDVRVSSGEVQIIAGLLLGLLWMTVTRQRAVRVALIGTVAVLLGGLLLAKSRGPWITAILGLLVAGALAPWSSKRRLIPYTVGGVVATGIVGFMVLGDRLSLIAIGLLRRFSSISGAMTQDISLLNRYAETAYTMKEVWQSPVFGHGWGAPVEAFDLINLVSTTHSFVHNGYAWLLHKVGIVGLLCFLCLFGGAMASGVFASRTAALPRHHRALAAAGTGILTAYTVLALPSNPFAVLDQVIVVVVVLGLTAGLWERGQLARPPAP